MKLKASSLKRATMTAFTLAALAIAGAGVFQPSQVGGAPLEDTKALYQTKCAICHSVDGSGTATGKKLNARDLRSAEVQKQSDAQLTEIITKGKNKMPAYQGKLTPEQIKQLIAHVRSLAKKG